jgi:hypothetical protein
VGAVPAGRVVYLLVPSSTRGRAEPERSFRSLTPRQAPGVTPSLHNGHSQERSRVDQTDDQSQWAPSRTIDHPLAVKVCRLPMRREPSGMEPACDGREGACLREL